MVVQNDRQIGNPCHCIYTDPFWVYSFGNQDHHSLLQLRGFNFFDMSIWRRQLPISMSTSHSWKTSFAKTKKFLTWNFSFWIGWNAKMFEHMIHMLLRFDMSMGKPGFRSLHPRAGKTNQQHAHAKTFFGKLCPQLRFAGVRTAEGFDSANHA